MPTVVEVQEVRTFRVYTYEVSEEELTEATLSEVVTNAEAEDLGEVANLDWEFGQSGFALVVDDGLDAALDRALESLSVVDDSDPHT